MSIVSPLFYLLLLLTVLLLAAVPSAWRRAVLLAASLVFYLSANLVSAFAGLAIVGINFLFLRSLLRESSERAKDRVYQTSITFNLTVFVVLKLVFEPSAGGAAAPWTMFGLPLAYPLGLSFILLMLHAALTDAYVERHAPRGRADTFLLYGTFFPYVTSGPVERLVRMEDQFDGLRKPTLEDLRAGLALIALGLVKKTVVANRLDPYVTAVFGGELHYSAPTVALGIALNTVRLYADFSGYTDIARGAARCMGIEVAINFDKPFVSRSVTEFWRRWHITFSSWLRDYLYMPLAFSLNRITRAAPSVAIFLTFLVAGFWHRATWTFMLFGLVHGLALALETRFGKPIKATGGAWRQRALVAAARGYTMVFVAGSLVLFSASSIPHAGTIVARLVTSPVLPWPREVFGYLGPFMFLLMAGAIAAWFVLERWHERLRARTTAAFLLVCGALVLFLGSTGPGFIYEQF